MLGPEGVARGVAGRLRERLPAMVSDMRTANGWSAADFPAPETKNIHPHEVDVIEIGAFPSVMVTILNTGGRTAPVRHSTTESTYDEYHFRYRVRIFFYVNASDYGPTGVQRMRLLLAIREALLRDRSFGEVAPQAMTLDELTYAEELESGIGEVEAGGGRKLIGSGAATFEVMTTERIELGPGESQEIAVVMDEEPPRHPAAD